MTLSKSSDRLNYPRCARRRQMDSETIESAISFSLVFGVTSYVNDWILGHSHENPDSADSSGVNIAVSTQHELELKCFARIFADCLCLSQLWFREHAQTIKSRRAYNAESLIEILFELSAMWPPPLQTAIVIIIIRLYRHRNRYNSFPILNSISIRIHSLIFPGVAEMRFFDFGIVLAHDLPFIFNCLCVCALRV